MLLRGHGVTVVGPTVHDAVDETCMAERTCMYQIPAMQTGRLHLNTRHSVLDRAEPEYAT